MYWVMAVNSAAIASFKALTIGFPIFGMMPPIEIRYYHLYGEMDDVLKDNNYFFGFQQGKRADFIVHFACNLLEAMPLTNPINLVIINSGQGESSHQ